MPMFCGVEEILPWTNNILLVVRLYVDCDCDSDDNYNNYDGYNIDDEQRGFKLLKRPRLSGDQLRLILSHTQNSCVYEET